MDLSSVLLPGEKCLLRKPTRVETMASLDKARRCISHKYSELGGLRYALTLGMFGQCGIPNIPNPRSTQMGGFLNPVVLFSDISVLYDRICAIRFIGPISLSIMWAEIAFVMSRPGKLYYFPPNDIRSTFDLQPS